MKKSNKTRYFIVDLSDLSGTAVEFASKKEFINSMLYNRSVAKEEGDSGIESIKKVLETVNTNKDCLLTFNEFDYVKKTNKSYGYYGILQIIDAKGHHKDVRKKSEYD